MCESQRPFGELSKEDLLEFLHQQQKDLESATSELREIRSISIKSGELAAVRFLEKTQDRATKNIGLINDEIEIRKQINRAIAVCALKNPRKRKLIRSKTMISGY